MDEFAAANLANWNERAALHATDTTGSYRIAAVLAGGSSLHAIEAAEVGDPRPHRRRGCVEASGGAPKPVGAARNAGLKA